MEHRATGAQGSGGAGRAFVVTYGGDDFILDLLQRVKRKFGDRASDTALRQVEIEVRQVWGGSRPYIARTSNERRRLRNRHIITAWSDGEGTSSIAQRMGLSPKHVRRLIKAAKNKP